MLYQTCSKKSLLVLLMVAINLCSGMQCTHKNKPLTSPYNIGMKIVSARCGDRFYTEEQISGTLEMGKTRLMLQWQAGSANSQTIKYNPEPTENIPFQAPYYYYRLGNDKTSGESNDKQTDLVIFTGYGQLAKVVSYQKIRHPHQPRDIWRREDCTLSYEKVSDIEQECQGNVIS